MNKYLVTYQPLFISEIAKEIEPNKFETLARGLLLLESPTTPELILSHGIYKVDAIEPIDVDQIVQSIKNLLDKTEGFAIKCHIHGNKDFTITTIEKNSRDIEVQVGTKLEQDGFIVDRKNPTAVILLTLAQNTAFITKSKPTKNPSNTDTNANDNEEIINRSQLKLREAINYFNLDLQNVKTALDIGAAPGGFSNELSKRGIKVTAIDPENLNPTLANDKNIQYLQIRAEDFAPKEKFDMLVNDMNLHPRESAGIMLVLSKFIKPKAQCVMTIKCPSRNVFHYIDTVKELLKKDFKDFKFKHLPHNKMEITMQTTKT